MAKNTLFNFLFHNEANIQLPHGHKLVLGVNKSSQHAYYRLELPRGHYLIKDGKKTSCWTIIISVFMKMNFETTPS